MQAVGFYPIYFLQFVYLFVYCLLNEPSTGDQQAAVPFSPLFVCSPTQTSATHTPLLWTTASKSFRP